MIRRRKVEMATCPTCNGSGMAGSAPCPTCKGTGNSGGGYGSAGESMQTPMFQQQKKQPIDRDSVSPSGNGTF